MHDRPSRREGKQMLGITPQMLGTLVRLRVGETFRVRDRDRVWFRVGIQVRVGV